MGKSGRRIWEVVGRKPPGSAGGTVSTEDGPRRAQPDQAACRHDGRTKALLQFKLRPLV